MSRSSLLRAFRGWGPPVIVGLLGGLVVAEVLARLAWQDAWRETSEIPAEHAGLPQLISVGELGAPNVRGVSRGVLHRTNSLGMRGPQFERQAAAGVFRIAIGGDSTTMGSGVEEEDRYSDRLERMLNADGARRYEVLNAGLSGINTDAVVQRLERVGRGYLPRLFVYGFSTNDIEGPSYESLAAGASPAEVAAFYWAWVARVERSRSYFLRFLSFRILVWSASSAAATREIHHNFFENPPARAAFLRGLDRLAALVRQRSACGHVLIHSDLAALDETHPALDIYALVEEEARKRGLGVTQSFPYFEGRDPAPLWVNLFDPHPNAAGHEILARALYDGLMALPASCWELPPAPARRRAPPP